MMKFERMSLLIRDNGELEFFGVGFKDIYFVLHFRYWIARNLKILNKKFKYKLLPKKFKKEENKCQK